MLPSLKLCNASLNPLYTSSSVFSSITVPYVSSGNNSLAPPLFVVKIYTLHAAASNNEVENPSESEGKAKISDAFNKSIILSNDNLPNAIIYSESISLIKDSNGPSPARQR